MKQLETTTIKLLKYVLEYIGKMTEEKSNQNWFVPFGIGCLLFGNLFKSCVLIEADKKLDSIEAKLEKEQIVKNVLGQEIPEKFYEIDGKRVYLEIDGKPVEEYFRGEE